MEGAFLAFAITLAVNFVAYFASDRIVLARYRARDGHVSTDDPYHWLMRCARSRGRSRRFP